jgi:hypothetical protein
MTPNDQIKKGHAYSILAGNFIVENRRESTVNRALDGSIYPS